MNDVFLIIIINKIRTSMNLFLLYLFVWASNKKKLEMNYFLYHLPFYISYKLNYLHLLIKIKAIKKNG